MTGDDSFDLENFLPYLLNGAAERTGLGFQKHYRATYGMLRSEWRALFHLGHHGDLTACDICESAGEHKTRVSRAVAALEKKRFLTRTVCERDRRIERLSLTRSGRAAYLDLVVAARDYDATLMGALSEEERGVLRRCLSRLGEKSAEDPSD